MSNSKHPLPTLIQRHLGAIQALCSKHKVRKFWVFGSVLRDELTSDSDVDFLYELDRKNIRDEEFLHNFWGFYDGLKALLGREVDLIKYATISNPYFKAEVDETKILIYEQEGNQVSV